MEGVHPRARERRREPHYHLGGRMRDMLILWRRCDAVEWMVWLGLIGYFDFDFGLVI